MFFPLLLISPIFASNDKFMFHTRASCYFYFLHPFQYNIVFTGRNSRPYYENITERFQSIISTKRNQIFSVAGSLSSGDSYENYFLRAQIQHDCTREGETKLDSIPIIAQCKSGKNDTCHVYVDIALASGIARVHKVEYV